MKKALFFRLGKRIYRFRKVILILMMMVVITCLPFMPHIMAPFNTTGFVDEHSDGVMAERYINKKLGFNRANQLIILYHSKTQSMKPHAFIQKIKKSLSALQRFPMEHEIIYPDVHNQQISKDRHTAYAVVIVKSLEPLNHEQLSKLKALIKVPRAMTIQWGGDALFTESLNKQTQQDLYKADAIAAPASLIVLILVFGTIIASLIPLCLGGGCALIILTTLYFFCHIFSLSIFTLNIALLLGLCLSLDYSLFIIYRFRREMSEGYEVSEAIAVTLATAGRAVFYSGLAVFISLSALMLFPINILFSIGVGGLSAVFVAVSVAIIGLPAILSLIGTGIERWPLFKLTPHHVWRSLATTVVKHPYGYFILSLTVLLLLSYPLLSVRLGLDDFHIFPKHSDSRQFFDAYKAAFNERELTPIVLIVSAKNGRILSQRNVSRLVDFAHKLKRTSGVARVNSIVTTTPKLLKKQYQRLYGSSKRLQTHALKQLLNTTTRQSFTVMRIVSKNPVNSTKTKKLIQALRLMNPGNGLTLRLTGAPVENDEVITSIARFFPYAIAWIVLLTYVILLFLLRSIFLPLKAIFMNVLSLCASYGVLVFIFQEGHLHQWLMFEPQGLLDVSLLIIMFCALFGFSMDYEVFLLTRIQESYRKTKQNQSSIIFGMEQSGRIITSAALIVICLCGSFMVADVLMVKEFGLGIAVAIFVDAFIIRTILVPATMVLMNRWNWYLPTWLSKILPKQQ